MKRLSPELCDKVRLHILAGKSVQEIVGLTGVCYNTIAKIVVTTSEILQEARQAGYKEGFLAGYRRGLAKGEARQAEQALQAKSIMAGAKGLAPAAKTNGKVTKIELDQIQGRQAFGRSLFGNPLL